jgi:hypothetical protein
MHLAAEMLADLRSCLFADRAQTRTALADDDGLLAVTLDEDLLVDDGRAILAVLPALRLDR